jgi:hypothetical protein
MRTSHKLLIAALSLASCGLVHGANEVTPMTYSASVSDVNATNLAPACAINIVQVSDQRFNKESIGAEYPIVASAPEPWIISGLDNLKAYGFTVQVSDKPVAEAINLNVKLIRAYTWFGHMRINGMVAFDVDMASGAGQRTEKFRAAGSKTNMWGAKDEHVTALNYAFNHAMHKMATALQLECAQAKLGKG